ncbi:DUF805 domain-containing protein [uncultured Pseudomonas sp.]|uniref:DUF805 domain-containing protein n=1 Tax=uncultured Pseudomonas sp. TaxID=114707 RepID=UPI0025EEE86F|nr:DUF805 domain-containing protein [uncultured Pseudomonas sp.]
MTETHFRIVFEGQLFGDVAPETARANLAQLFKSELAAVEPLFNGQPHVLKRGLDQPQAQRYLQALQEAGVQAHIEPEVSLNLDKVEPLAPTPPAHPAPPAEPFSPYAPPKAEVEVESPQGYGQLKVFSLSGRIGRLRYLAWSLALISILLGAMIVGSVFMPLSEGLASMGMIAISLVVVAATLPIGVQRLHDMGWSGWLLLLNLVPFVGSLFPLVMMFMPGTRGPNRYGPPPPPNSRAVKILAGVWLVLVVIMTLLVIIGGLVSE